MPLKQPKPDPFDVLAAWCREHGFPEPEREYLFAWPVRGWAFDFCWPTLKIALELEGGTFMAGRHTRGAGHREDCDKYNEAALRGWLLLRIETGKATSEKTLGLIRRAMGVRA